MRTFLLPGAALTLALVLSAFSFVLRPSLSYKYAIYDESGAQNLLTNYAVQSEIPSMCLDDNALCWFRVQDVNSDGGISNSEFSSAFDALDTNNDGSLDDENEQAGVLEKEFWARWTN